MYSAEINAFLMGEGWPRLSYGTFKVACADANASYSILNIIPENAPPVICMKPAEARKLLEYLAETPLINPAVEVALSELEKSMGFYSGSRLNTFLAGTNRTGLADRYVRKRRAGLGQAYRIVNAIELEGGQLLIQDMMATSPKLRQRLGELSASTIVTMTQQRTMEAFWRRKLRSTLSSAAIDAFLGPSSKLPSLTPGSTPQPLDSSYKLSKHGAHWRNYAACNEIGPDIFLSENTRDIEQALGICATCEVKGDCLLFALRQADEEGWTEGVLGGFTKSQREKLGTKTIEWLQMSTRAADTT